jgi:hypothetical protein
LQLFSRARCHDFSAARSRTGAQVEHVVGTPDGVFIVLDDEQRITSIGELIQRIEQDLVVARMQTDRRFIQDVTDALQIRTELRSQTNALRLTARQRWRRSIER